jgi:tetratricopeptide (TPR) repeat protein
MRRSRTCFNNSGIKSLLCGFAFVFAQAPALSLSQEEYHTQSNRCHGYVTGEHFDEAIRGSLPLTHSRYADARLFVDLADCYRQEWGQHLMQVDAAKECCKKALTLNASYGCAYDMLGQIASVQGQQDEAINQFAKALSVSEPEPVAWYHRAKAYASSHRYIEALADLNTFEKHIKTNDPNDHDSVMALNVIRGQVYQGLGKYDLAAVAYKKSYPKYRSEWTEEQILECTIKADKLPEAIKELSNRITRDPQDDDSYFKRAGLKVRQKQFKEAIADYTSAIKIAPTPTYYKERAKAYQEIGENELAKKDLEKAKIPVF